MASTLLRWWLVVVCYLVLGSSSAYADDALAPPTNAKAREHFVRGNRLYRIREFAKAVDEYKAGSLAQPVTVFLYNLGQCHRQLGKHKEALWYYEMFLKRGNPTGELRQYTEKFIAEMKAELDKMAKPPAEPSPGSRPSPDVAASLKPAEPPSTPTIVRQPWHRDRPGLTIAATGLVMAGISGALFLGARSLESDANRDDREQRRMELRDRASSRRLFGSVLGAAGVGLTIGGIIKLAINPPADRSDRLAFGIALSADGFAFLGRMSIP